MSFNIKMYTTILLIAISSVLAKSSTIADRFACPSICPALYAPVCGTDGENFTEFGNPCMMESSNCKIQKIGSKFNPFVETDLAWCRTTPAENMDAIYGNLDFNKSECMEPCTLIYQPLCVADNKYRTTISSRCVSDMYNCVLRSNGIGTLFRVLKEGSC